MNDAIKAGLYTVLAMVAVLGFLFLCVVTKGMAALLLMAVPVYFVIYDEIKTNKRKKAQRDQRRA